ncbi:MAG: GNAT family N-acetyltransferase [Oenococcus oeni]|uniref:GNAT family N-acetyltransferase n=1 Tax=Oenococcus oeni TaxID=1247 RepID=UPI0010BB267A|nr:GNAT family N-acetyltransferase [Oenococcus oeni]SYW09458.1 putative acetyltransferase [Oenococcus oeni]SYW17766.1 putative acetyltransferase [Oenococcus oeni]
MNEYQIKFKEDCYYAENKAGKVIGELLYSKIKQGKVISINQVRVDPLFRNRGIAGKLLKKAVDDAVKNGQLIKAVCSFSKKAFLQNKNYQKYEYKEN